MLPAFALVGLTVACGAGGSGAGDVKPSSSAAAPGSGDVGAVAKDDALAGMVPADVKADGKILVGQDQSYPPNEFQDNGKAAGFDVDLGTAIGQVLGVQMEFQNASFDGIIPGIGSKKYEMAMSSFSITSERLQTVDMISYYKAGTSLGVVKGNPDGIKVDDLCGKKVAVQKGTTQVEDLDKKNAACTGAGKPAIDVTQLQAQTDVNLALTAKRVQAELADSPVVDYAVKQTNGALEVVGEPYDTAPYGIVLGKNSGDFGKAVQGAVQKLIDSGAYKKILDKWGLSAAGSVTKSEINPAS
ncbi:ABC transporter substrate-binding protein [Amycolatopsis mediterranei S699]|uniref:ABC transport system substrate-binding protein n=2 Tax=Amycolatopsis mediterranei TaxID=33910 RepID=A0A0H3DL21_AMYMU|nr:ABC transporter substrate-binding protein [Amycolatopsis mediterranei]ADJ50898.1 ABC transport system substrate-binding protein [Amycolatopsis mediterranei U32]AEK47911.1 ABC transporter substrate-binding protein [Amycolatopsis mediterranei S699]AFO82604.1 ABC transporter substrate-binding protein [Amycolatopsis mediterranei S699]AGT89733.1 ABC transporter substrate-binding protein [Amycolatopsis mediterranei RB]UZF75784.1 ABC transporter substrate-binding protein [Amycolatopsis mediterrane